MKNQVKVIGTKYSEYFAHNKFPSQPCGQKLIKRTEKPLGGDEKRVVPQ